MNGSSKHTFFFTDLELGQLLLDQLTARGLFPDDDKEYAIDLLWKRNGQVVLTIEEELNE